MTAQFPIIETDCTIHAPDGTPFTNSGALFDLDHGGCLYVQGDRKSDPDGTYHPYRGPLTTWHGERVGTWHCTGEYRNNTGATITCIRADIAGREYFGRYGSDWSQLVNLRPRKRKGVY